MLGRSIYPDLIISDKNASSRLINLNTTVPYENSVINTNILYQMYLGELILFIFRSMPFLRNFGTASLFI